MRIDPSLPHVAVAAPRGRRFPGVLAVVGIVATLLFGAELFLRYLGLHVPVLYEATDYGYRVKPNQDVRRFGNRISYNEFGMRAEEAFRMPAPGTLRVLCIGDSITNGGTLVDQTQTYPYLLEARLREDGLNAEVLNISAAGWGLENAAGWLRESGTFGAHVVVLEVATHDLFQPMAPSSTVGTHPSFPGSVPRLALGEAVRRYLLPRLIPGVAADPGTVDVSHSIDAARQAISTVLRMAGSMRAAGAHVLVLHVEQPGALEPTDSVTRAAKQALYQALANEGIEVATTAAQFGVQSATSLFRDAYHPNAAGNRVLADVVAQRMTGFDAPLPLPVMLQ